MAPAKKVKQQSSVESAGKQGDIPAVFEPISSFFEKKVRNLEKRKSKLESYRALQKEGKLTDAGQKQAVEKYDEVNATLFFASTIMQELLPVLLEISNGIEKRAVDREKEKERLTRSTIRSVLDIQDLYEQLGDDKVRANFASGTDNALLLTEDQLATIDSLYMTSKPSRYDSEGNLKSKGEYKRNLDECVGSWHKLLQKSECKDKPGEVKSTDMKSLFDSIGSCDFFDSSKKKVQEVMPAEVNNNHEPVTVPEPQVLETHHEKPPAEPTAENHDVKSTQADILGSLQGRVVNFVQDDFGHLQNTLPVVTPSLPNSSEVTFNGGYQDTYSDLSANMQTMNLDSNVPHTFNHFNGNVINDEPPKSSLPPSMTNNATMFSSSAAPQGTFPAAESWADEASEMFDKNMGSSGGDNNFTEVKQRGGMNNRYQGRNDFGGRGGGGGGGYRNEYSRGMNRGGRGFEARGYGNRPYRNEFRDDQNQGGNRQEGGNYSRGGGGGRGFGGGGGGKEFSRSGGPGNRGPGDRRPRGGYDNRPPPQMFTSANAAK
ncbi:uncharacterized protein DDB_G0290685-like [Symsagittifera roscoffensis]|uniref:uncharacterized protein DDB_G0290685-like n=1 Tax=Symsagittifera roscoffensis TaxID=84072 RepID=UPI00307B2634